MLTKREKLRKTLKRLRRNFRPRSRDTIPVFILGEMRSGTNMLAECFDRCIDADVYHETDDEAFVDYELREISEIRELISLSNGTHAVFKSIADSNRADELLDAFPDAKVFWIYRRYQDAVNSAMEKWVQHNEYLRLVLEEPERARWRLRNLTPDDLALIRTHYERQLSEPSARALIWFIRNRFYFNLGLQGRADVLLINYEELVTSPRERLRAAFDFVGLPFDDRFFQHVSTSSIRKQAEPEIDAQVAALCDGLMSEFAAMQRPAAQRRVNA
jgi:hypothetical protein